MGQLEPVSSNLDSPIQNVLGEPLGLVSDRPASQTLSISTEEMGMMEEMPNNSGPQKISILNKRKAPTESMFNNSATHQVSMSNKRVPQVEHRPWLQQQSASNKKTLQSMSNVLGSQPSPTQNKRMVRLDSIPNKSGPQKLTVPKNQTAQMEPSPRVQTESFESVRSKLRESLTDALALVTQQQDKPSQLESSKGAGFPGKTCEDSQAAGSVTATADITEHASEKPKEILLTNEDSSAQEYTDGRSSSKETSVNEYTGDSTLTSKSDGLEFQSNAVLPDENVSFVNSFFVKDELLQGNGLSWALDRDTEVGEKKAVQIGRKCKLDHEEVAGDEKQALESPHALAFKIEAELFKIFGGVNKKYKEKGRSLLFNLKDRNNPTLRERVMSGEIPPERLCSMTAEELASEELSQWRIAKAEELAQMVVLPDSEVDIRRLVRKTHKGEFQVEVERDDSVSVEVSAGASTLTQNRSKTKDEVNTTGEKTHNRSKTKGREGHSPKPDEANATAIKNNLEGQDPECTFTIPPNEGNDLMQGLMGDELKDTEFLPPIVSLDEFMETLDSEPPFGGLPVDAEKATISDKDHSEVGSTLNSSDLPRSDPVGSTPEVDVNDAKSDTNARSNDSPVPSKTPTPKMKGELAWEGLLQLNISAGATVSAFFRSGEKTCTKEWPSCIEIKGRVKLDPFEKFLQELRMSRSRGIMVVHFVSQDGSPEIEAASIREVAESYLVDERVGIAEPSSGVELYFCPPHTKTLEMLTKHLPKDLTESISMTSDGLIGLVIWRKPQLTSTHSPNHKHSSKKQHHSTSKRHHQEKEKDAAISIMPVRSNLAPPVDDEDDDIPPGFGPPAARDEDDLPEFNFSSGGSKPSPSSQFATRVSPFPSAPHTPSRPVQQMRDLVHKYGQSGNSDKSGIKVPFRSWKDDDDDMPEWNPQQQLPPPPMQPPMQPLVMVPQMFNQPPPPPHLIPLTNPPPMPVWSHGGGWWGPSPGPNGIRAPVGQMNGVQQNSIIGCQPTNGAQFYPAPARQDATRSRGF